MAQGLLNPQSAIPNPQSPIRNPQSPIPTLPMPYLGLSLAILVGLLLGLLGGGGSILAVPIFVYVLGLDPKLAIATSLAVVSITSLVGTWPHYRNGNVDARTALLFIIGSSAGAYGAANWLSSYLSGTAQLLLFAIVMLTASFFMLRGRRDSDAPQERLLLSPRMVVMTVLQGIGVGVVTGLVGVGGGFMIVPALVLLAGLPMKRAVGTSLLVIAINSAAGFAGYITKPEIRSAIGESHVGSFELVPLLMIFTLITVAGALAGSALSSRISPAGLRRAFGVFLIVMAVFILVQNAGAI
jgi:uncharacterized membrane protein YfcA